MKIAFLSILLAVCSFSVSAHPGSGIVVDSQGQVYFVDGPSSRIMKIDAAGKVSVFYEDKNRQLINPHHLFIDQAGNLYSADADASNSVWKITPAGEISKFYPAANTPNARRVGFGGDPFAIDKNGAVYCIEEKQYEYTRIHRLPLDGTAVHLCGGARGFADGKGAAAKFGELHGAAMACGPDGTLYVTDGVRIRKVTSDGTVSTLAGSGKSGTADGTGAAADFKMLIGIAVDDKNNIWAADQNGIRRVTPDGTVTTIKNSAPSRGYYLSGVAPGKDGELYILEWSDKYRVRKITNNGGSIILTTGP